MLRRCNLYVGIIFALVNLSSQNYTYNVEYLEVPVDHFTFTTNETFKLRYLVNDHHFNGDGPIFFYTGNEGPIETFAENTGFMWEAAAEFRALIIFAEHRYYGKSLPFGNESFSNPNHLGYLTSSQALADYVCLINYLQKNIEKGRDSPVIAFGGSYGGMLSAWLRMKYPASVVGAIAASAPIWQFQGLTPCGVFNRIITSVFSVASDSCVELIRKSWAALRNMTSSVSGKNSLSTTWKLCEPLKTDNDVETLIEWLIDVYANLAMINYPYPTDFLAPVPGHPVKAFCNKIDSVPKKPEALLAKLGKALSVYTNYTQKSKCVDVAQSTKNIGLLGWNFQACTEMIMPMCSTHDDMFENYSWNFTAYAEECYRTFGIRPRRSDLAILEYGGKNIDTASNIIFSNGLLDPWSGGGVLTNVSQGVAAVLIPEGAHHLDLRPSNPADPSSVVTARQFYKTVMYDWIQDYYRERLNTIYYLDI